MFDDLEEKIKQESSESSEISKSKEKLDFDKYTTRTDNSCTPYSNRTDNYSVPWFRNEFNGEIKYPNSTQLNMVASIEEDKEDKTEESALQENTSKPTESEEPANVIEDRVAEAHKEAIERAEKEAQLLQSIGNSIANLQKIKMEDLNFKDISAVSIQFLSYLKEKSGISKKTQRKADAYIANERTAKELIEVLRNDIRFIQKCVKGNVSELNMANSLRKIHSDKRDSVQRIAVQRNPQQQLPDDKEGQIRELKADIEKAPQVFIHIKSVKELPQYAQETFKFLKDKGWPKETVKPSDTNKCSKEFNKQAHDVFHKVKFKFYWEYDVNQAVDAGKNNVMFWSKIAEHKSADNRYRFVDKSSDVSIQAYYIDLSKDKDEKPLDENIYGRFKIGNFEKIQQNDQVDENTCYYLQKNNSMIRDCCRFIHTDCGIVFFTNDHHSTYKYLIEDEDRDNS